MPGDKSISHRAAIISALARGRTRITNYSTAADCASTLDCLARLGVRVERDGDTVNIEGAGRGEPGAWSFVEPREPLDCGNSGTTMRLLAGVLAGQPFASVLTGDDSLRARPMRRIVEPLELMGARISTEEGARAPLRIEGRPLRAIEYQLPVASAQVKSCVLLAALAAEGSTAVTEIDGVETRDHTERMLDWFGVNVERHLVARGYDPTHVRTSSLVVHGPAAFDTPGEVAVPGDISSAAFFGAAAAMLPGSDLTIADVGQNETRAWLFSLLGQLGAEVRQEASRLSCNEPVNEIRVQGTSGLKVARGRGKNGRLTLRGGWVARLIDELPVLAVVGTQIEGGVEVRDAAELRVKESDRIRAVVENLRAMGAEVEEYEDGFAVSGPVKLRGARLDSHGDHRIAMAFAVAALTAEGESEIVGAEECVGVSFPEFFGLLESVVER